MWLMWKVWLKEQWYDIRYAHKSLWVSILVLAGLAAGLTFYMDSRYYNNEIAKRDELIAGYKAQNDQLRDIIAGKYPQSNKAAGNASGDLQDKVNGLKNDLNNAESQAGVTYRDYKQKVNGR